VKVLLREDVKGVGRRGDVVDVKNGFARNYLLPTGAGIVATDATATQAAAMRRSRDLVDAQSRGAAETQRSVLEGSTITVAARASANGRLFGSVTETDVAAAVLAQTAVQLDRHQITMVEHLKQVGSTSIVAHLFGGVNATFTVEVVAQA
jgi:large subunit ribosomal protein L9